MLVGLKYLGGGICFRVIAGIARCRSGISQQHRRKDLLETH